MKQEFGLIAIGLLFLYVFLRELDLLRTYIDFFRNGRRKNGKVIFTFSQHDKEAVFKVKIIDGEFEYSKHVLKTSVISAIWSPVLKHEFRVLIKDGETYCVPLNPVFLIVDWILLTGMGIGLWMVFLC